MHRRLFLFLALLVALVIAGCSGNTTGATNVTSTSAQLNGTGTCGSSDPSNGAYHENCYWHFEHRVVGAPSYTIDPTYNTGPTTTPITSGFNDSITGLASSTNYEFRVCGKGVPNGDNSVPPNSDYTCVGRNGDPNGPSETFSTAAGSGTVLFDGSRIANWSGVYSCPGSSNTDETASDGSLGLHFHLIDGGPQSLNNTQNGCIPGAVTPNERVQVEGPKNILNGDDIWLSFKLLLKNGEWPADLPNPLAHSPNNFASLVGIYGGQTNGSCGFQIGQRPGQGLVLPSDQNQGNYYQMWTDGLPLPFDQIVRYTVHIKWSNSASDGFLEFWKNGVQQNLKDTDGSYKLHLPHAFIEAGCNDAGMTKGPENRISAGIYRHGDNTGTWDAHLYGLRRGTTRAAAEGG